MPLSLKECIQKVRDEYPDLEPVQYIEADGLYLFNLHDPKDEQPMVDFHFVDSNSGYVTGSIPMRKVFGSPQLAEKLKHPNKVSDIEHGSFKNANYLSHYGIKGQQWGVRRFQNEDGTYTHEGKIRYGRISDNGIKGSMSYEDAELSAYAVIGLASIGISIALRSYAKNKLHKDYKENNERLSEEHIGDIADLRHFSESNPPKKISGEHSVSDDIVAVNPKFNTSVKGSTSNCVLTSITYDLRRRGYDVTAKMCTTGMQSNKTLKEIYPGAKEQRIWAMTWNDVHKKVANKFPEGSRGVFSVSGEYGGHEMAWEIRNKKMIVIDPQDGQIIRNLMDDSVISRQFSPNTVRICRTDNLSVNWNKAHIACAELKSDWKKTLKNYENTPARSGDKPMTRNEKRKSLEEQWKKLNPNANLNAAGKQAMENWVDSNMWSDPKTSDELYHKEMMPMRKIEISSWKYGENSLMHYGIKGQKYGVRRFQNEDGSLTPAGKERYGIGDKKEKKKKDTIDANGNDRSKWKNDDPSKLTDQELNARNNRLLKEKQYKELTQPKWKSDLKKTGKQWALEATKAILITTATTLLAAMMTKKYEDAGHSIKKMFNFKTKDIPQALAVRPPNGYFGGGGKKKK